MTPYKGTLNEDNALIWSHPPAETEGWALVSYSADPLKYHYEETITSS